MYTLSDGSTPQTHLEAYYLFADLQIAIAFLNSIDPPMTTVAPSKLVPLPVDDRSAFYTRAKLAGVGQIVEVASAGARQTVFVDDFLRGLETVQ